MIILKYNEKYKWFECKIEDEFGSIDLHISDYGKDEITTAAKLSNEIISWYKINRGKIYDYAATDELIQLKNETWLEEDEVEITREEFIERIRVQSISIYYDGNFEVWFDDGDIFWGHGIKVDFSKDFKFIESEMM